MSYYVRLDKHTGLQDAFSDALSTGTASDGLGGGTLEELGIGWDQFIAYDGFNVGTPFTTLSYDQHNDRIIVTRGGIYANMLTPGSQFSWLPGIGYTLPAIMHASIDAESLNPRNDLSIDSINGLMMTVDGSAMGFCRDPNTGQFFQCTWDYYVDGDSNGDNLGSSLMSSGEMVGSNKYNVNSVTAQVATDDINLYTSDTVYSRTIHELTTFHRSQYQTLGAHPNVLVFDDVVIYLYQDFSRYSWISVIRRSNKEWLGSRRINLGAPMQLCPTGKDKGMALCWYGFDATSPIVALTFHWDRSRSQLVMDRLGTIISGHNYTTGGTYQWPQAKWAGYATYDINRQAVVMLNADNDTFERYALYTLCHPGRPSQMEKPVPLDVLHSDTEIDIVVHTNVELNPARQPSVFVSYGDTPNNYFSTTPIKTISTDQHGMGSFNISLNTNASGNSVSVICSLSTYSVGVSATIGMGTLYGMEKMIIAASSTFTLSAGITVPGIIGQTTILPGRPALQSDSVGAGTPQELHYPTSALNTPLVFELNPQLFTNVASEILSRPLYSSQRTLTKTATVQFASDDTDLEIKLTWIGGGDRAAMTWTFFSQLYNYFANVPDISNGSYIQWKPKDLSNHTYNILFTGLSVGGSNDIQLSNLIKAMDGFVNETVEATFRVVSTVE